MQREVEHDGQHGLHPRHARQLIVGQVEPLQRAEAREAAGLQLRDLAAAEVDLAEVRQRLESRARHDRDLVLLKDECVEAGHGGEAEARDLVQLVGTEVNLHQVEQPGESLSKMPLL